MRKANRTCKAKKFQDRMKHRGSGMAEGENKGMAKQILTPKKSSYSQSKDGNGGK